jgi:hypothetical protein
MVFNSRKQSLFEIYFYLIDMINKDNKIETLEKELQAMGNVIKTNEENQVKITNINIFIDMILL